MVGPPGFEPGSDGPQPPSIGQANPRARGITSVSCCTERCDFLNEVEVSNVHSAATVTLQTHSVEGFCVGFAIHQQLLEFFPLVGDHAATTETTNWNNHSYHLIDRTSASCGERHDRVDAWAPCGVDR